MSHHANRACGGHARSRCVWRDSVLRSRFLSRGRQDCAGPRDRAVIAGVTFMRRWRWNQPPSAIRSVALVVATSAALIAPGTTAAQGKHYPLESTDGLRLHNVAAESATLQGKKGLRVTVAEETLRRLTGMTPE